MPNCRHGELTPKTGFSHKTRRQWAAWMCPEADRGCDPVWISEAEVFACWLNSVSGNGLAGDLGDTPPF